MKKSPDVNLKEWNVTTVRHWQYNAIVTQTTDVINI